MSTYPGFNVPFQPTSLTYASVIQEEDDMQQLQRLRRRQKSERGPKIRLDDRELALYLREFVEKIPVPAYDALEKEAKREKDPHSEDYLSDLLLNVGTFLSPSVIFHRDGTYLLPPLTIILTNCVTLDLEEVSRSVYVILRNAVFSLRQQEQLLEFLTSRRRFPKKGELNDYIVEDMSSDYDAFERTEKTPEDYIDWIIIFVTVVVNSLTSLISELTRLVNEVSTLKMQIIPKTVAEVEEFIRLERRERDGGKRK